MIGRCTVCLFMCLRNHLSGKRLYVQSKFIIIYLYKFYYHLQVCFIGPFGNYCDGCFVIYRKKIILELNIVSFYKTSSIYYEVTTSV